MGRSHRPHPQKLGAKLRLIRTRLNLTQVQMVERLKVKEALTTASISAYEKSQREPSLFTLMRYAELAGCSTDYLIDDRLELPTKRCKKVVR